MAPGMHDNCLYVCMQADWLARWLSSGALAGDRGLDDRSVALTWPSGCLVDTSGRWSSDFLLHIWSRRRASGMNGKGDNINFLRWRTRGRTIDTFVYCMTIDDPRFVLFCLAVLSGNHSVIHSFTTSFTPFSFYGAGWLAGWLAALLLALHFWKLWNFLCFLDRTIIHRSIRSPSNRMRSPAGCIRPSPCKKTITLESFSSMGLRSSFPCLSCLWSKCYVNDKIKWDTLHVWSPSLNTDIHSAVFTLFQTAGFLFSSLGSYLLLSTRSA